MLRSCLPWEMSLRLPNFLKLRLTRCVFKQRSCPQPMLFDKCNTRVCSCSKQVVWILLLNQSTSCPHPCVQRTPIHSQRPISCPWFAPVSHPSSRSLDLAALLLPFNKKKKKDDNNKDDLNHQQQHHHHNDGSHEHRNCRSNCQ